MKKIFKGAAIAFISFLTVYLLLFDLSSDTVAVIPFLIWMIYLTCFILELLIQYVEWKYDGVDATWISVVVVMFLITTPSFSNFYFLSAIFVGALAYYFGRKLKDHPVTYVISSLPAVIFLAVIIHAQLA
jgi:hypothetical protein